MRVRMAARAPPMVTAGRIKCCQEPDPDTGNQPSSNRKEKDENRPQREVRKRQSQQRDEAEGAVIPAIAMQSRTHTRWNCQAQRNRECRQRQLQRPRIGLSDDVSDVRVVAQRTSHIAVNQPTPVIYVLGAKWNIETVRVAGGDDVGSGSAFAQHLKDGIARHDVNQKENNGNHQPDHRQHI